MSFIPLVLSVIGTGMTLIGQAQQMQAQVDTANYNASVARENQAQTLETAKSIERAGKIEEDRLRRRKALTTGSQKAAYAAAGLELEGSPLEVMADTATEYEKDIAINKYNTATKKRQYLNSASRYGSKAAYREYEASQAKKLGYMSMGGTLLTSSSSWYSKYYNKK